MRYLAWLTVLVAGLCACSSVMAQEPCSDLSTVKSSVYGFRPSQLTEEQQTKKSADLDNFWEMVRNLGPEGVTCLRDLLAAESLDPFFAFNGSMLLYGLDQSAESLQTIAGAVGRSDLAELDPSAYVWLVVRLAGHEINTAPLAEKYLRCASVDTYLPQHGGMQLGRELGAVLLYGSMPSEQTDKSLIPFLTDQEAFVRDTAALVLALNMGEEGLCALRSLKATDRLPVEIRQEVERSLTYAAPAQTSPPALSRTQVLRRLAQIPHYGDDFWGVAGNEQLENSLMAVLTAEDVPTLREARRKSIAGVSDEVLYEYFALTKILRTLINRFRLYPQCRSYQD